MQLELLPMVYRKLVVRHLFLLKTKSSFLLNLSSFVSWLNNCCFHFVSFSVLEKDVIPFRQCYHSTLYTDMNFDYGLFVWRWFLPSFYNVLTMSSVSTKLLYLEFWMGICNIFKNLIKWILFFFIKIVLLSCSKSPKVLIDKMSL